MEIILQIFTGGYKGRAVSHEAVEQKLLSVLPRLPVRKVIMGWALDKTLYEKTAAFLKQRNIEFYLWFPVFSETGAIRELSPLEDYQGSTIQNQGHGEEDFSFCCPNNPQNIERIIDIFDTEFSSIPITGVFLDKIRYPSFANGSGAGQGLKNVFSCFCPHCLGHYEEEKFDTGYLKTKFSLSSASPLGILGYNFNGNYAFEDSGLSQFLLLKAQFISRGIWRIYNYLREKNYKIGLDVFAPFLAPFAGQDLKTLAGLCDFMKPMMYRITEAPAGLPYETEALLRETGIDDPVKKRIFLELLGINSHKSPFDLDFAVKELEKLAALSACPIYAGMEINRKPGLAEADPEYIEKTAAAYLNSGCRGIVLSWDLLEAPLENIAVLEKLFQKNFG